jgi:hypothetical protein
MRCPSRADPFRTLKGPETRVTGSQSSAAPVDVTAANRHAALFGVGIAAKAPSRAGTLPSG